MVAKLYVWIRIKPMNLKIMHLTIMALLNEKLNQMTDDEAFIALKKFNDFDIKCAEHDF